MKKNNILNIFKQVLFTILFVGLAVLVRVLIFSDLGRGIAYLTFYPTVALASLFVGFYGGLTVTIISGFLTYFWIQKGVLSHVELMAEVAFILSGLIISVVGGMKNITTNKIIAIKNELEIKNDDLLKQISARKQAEKKMITYNVLEQKVKERTQKLEQSEMSIKKTLDESERLNKLMVGRELEMIKLKTEIADLKSKK